MALQLHFGKGIIWFRTRPIKRMNLPREHFIRVLHFCNIHNTFWCFRHSIGGTFCFRTPIFDIETYN